MVDSIDEFRHALKCSEISLEGKRERIKILERILSEWIDSDYDDWMRCRNNAKISLGRDADPKEYLWKDDRDQYIIHK